ncbi:MAG: DUF192 domain-containing protein [Candidatus Ozemobacteraceae bacterium]
MKSRSLILSLALTGTILLPSCIPSHVSKGSRSTASAMDYSALHEPEAAQQLPLFDAIVGTTPLRIMIARTTDEMRTGLMFRTDLPESEGMLFVYPQTQSRLTFWMKNTLIPLDIAFFNSDLSLTEVIRGMKPGTGISEDQLPRYITQNPAQYALELASGSADRLHLQPGDRLTIPLTLLFSVGSR